MRNLIVAEWLKLRTTRLLYGMVPAAIALSLAAVSGAVLSADGAGVDLETTDGIRRALHVTGTGALLVLAIGIIISAGEYRTSTATDTFLTTPRRHQVIAAKLVTGAGLGLITGVITATASYAIAAALYRLEDATFPATSGEVWLTLLGTLAYTTLFATLGVAFGSLLRNQVIAVTVALAWFAVVEQTLVTLAADIGKWLPAGAGQAIVRTPVDGLLSPLAGTALLALYAATVAVAGIRVAATRDA
jgi:ABC-2 type transport system permease protein